MTSRTPQHARQPQAGAARRPGIHARGHSLGPEPRQREADTPARGPGPARPAGREVRVEVTTADIRAGEPLTVDERHPVAIAVARALDLPRRPPPYVRVGSCWFSIHVSGAFFETHDLPPGADQWIQDYDAGRPVAPFTFAIRTGWAR